METKISYDKIEEFEIAPGLVCTIRYEDNIMAEAIGNFLRHKASFGEVKKALKARGSLRYPGMAPASSKGGKLIKGGDEEKRGG